MIKVEYLIKMEYTFNSNHKGAHYSMDGGKTYKNHGEFCESAAKFQRGLEYLVNPATSFDTGSDIEQIHASVKTPGASLACIYGDNMEEILIQYFKKVKSTLWIIMIMDNNKMFEYHLNQTEFKNFLQKFGRLDMDSKAKKNKIRIKNLTKSMVSYLEDGV